MSCDPKRRRGCLWVATDSGTSASAGNVRSMIQREFVRKNRADDDAEFWGAKDRARTEHWSVNVYAYIYIYKYI